MTLFLCLFSDGAASRSPAFLAARRFRRDEVSDATVTIDDKHSAAAHYYDTGDDDDEGDILRGVIIFMLLLIYFIALYRLTRRCFFTPPLFSL